MEVSVSAPGKIFLLGEHFAVFGNPAFLASVNKRVTVSVRKAQAKAEISSLDNGYILAIINLLKDKIFHANLPGLRIKVSSQIKSGYHLGSSASVAVATISAILYFLKKIWNPELINKLAYEAEKIKHVSPSGADNSAVTFGGYIWYRKELDFLKNVYKIPLKLPISLNHFYLADTGLPRQSTKEMVSLVSKNYHRNKKHFEIYFSQNEQAVKNIVTALKTADSRLLINSLNIGGATLEKIGVVSRYVTPFIREVEGSGGAAKILGGGGKSGSVGYLLCFHQKKEELKKLSVKFNFPLEAITLGEEGLRLEEKNQ